MLGEDTILTDDPGVFAVGSWTPEHRDAYQEILSLVRALPPASSRLTSADDKKTRALALTGVDKFLKDLTSGPEGDGLAAWHEPSVHAVQWFMKLSPAFRSELSRRARTKKGRRCYRVSCEWAQLGKKRNPALTCVWHVVVPENSQLAELKAAILKAGKSVSQKYGNAANRCTEGGRFHVGQLVINDTGRRTSSKRYTIVENIGALQSSGGYYDVTIKRMRAPHGTSKSKSKATRRSEATTILGTQDDLDDSKAKDTERPAEAKLDTQNAYGKSKAIVPTAAKAATSNLDDGKAKAKKLPEKVKRDTHTVKSKATVHAASKAGTPKSDDDSQSFLKNANALAKSTSSGVSGSVRNVCDDTTSEGGSDYDWDGDAAAPKDDFSLAKNAVELDEIRKPTTGIPRQAKKPAPAVVKKKANKKKTRESTSISEMETLVRAEIDTTSDKYCLDSFLLRMGHCFVETEGNGWCGLFTLSELFRNLSPVDLVLKFHGLFVARVLATEDTQPKPRKPRSKKNQSAEKALPDDDVDDNDDHVKVTPLDAFLDLEIQDYKDGGNKSVLGKLKLMVAQIGSLQRDGVDPTTRMLANAAWMGTSMVLMAAMVAQEDIVVIDTNVREVMLNSHCDGRSVVLGRLPGRQTFSTESAGLALQLSTLQGNIWNRRSLACAVGGIVGRKGGWAPFFAPRQRTRVSERGLYLLPSFLFPRVGTALAIKKDLWEVVSEYLPFVKVIIHEPVHWSWAIPNYTLSEAERLGRFKPKLLDGMPYEKKHCETVRGLSIRPRKEWWKWMNDKIGECVCQPGMDLPLPTSWYRRFLLEQIRWGKLDLPTGKTDAYPRLHYDTGVESLLAAVRAGLNRRWRPASRTLLRDALLQHLSEFRWLYRTLLGPIDKPRSDAILLLEGSALVDAEGNIRVDAVPKAFAVLLVAVSHHFRVDLNLTFHHGQKMKKRGNKEAEPKRSSQSHYHECQVTQIALHDTVVLPRQTLDLAWLHCDGHDNSPVFFALGTLGAHAHHESFEVVHAGDVLHHKYDKEPPPTSSALTLYKCNDSLMMLFPGCVMDQSFDVRPSGLAEDDQFYVRYRESTHVPGLKELDGPVVPDHVRRGPSRAQKTWHQILEVRRGPSRLDLQWQNEEDFSALDKLPAGVTAEDGFYILDHTCDSEGHTAMQSLKLTAGYAALQAHARLQPYRIDLVSRVRSDMVGKDDKLRITNPPWVDLRDFVYKGSQSTGQLLSGAVRHDTKRGSWSPRPNRDLPSAGMRVCTYNEHGTAKYQYVLKYAQTAHQGTIFVLGPQETKLVPAEHDGDIPDEQAVFTVMFPQFRYLINSPMHTWVPLHDPSCPTHLGMNRVQTETAAKYGFAPKCIQGMRFLRLNRSNLLCPLLVRNTVGGGWKSLDFEWMLRHKDSKHFGVPETHPLTMYEWLLFGRDGETLDQKSGCSGVTHGGSLPTTNPFIRMGAFSPNIKPVDHVQHCVARSLLLLRMVEDADVAIVAGWEPRISLTPFEDIPGTLFGALHNLNKRLETYYIQTQKVMQLVDKTVYNDRVQRIQGERMHGLVEVAVRDTESDTGYRTNHVMAVVNGVLVDPSDGSTHPWPDRNTKPDDVHWLRDVTMFLPMKKVVKAPKKPRPASRTRRKRVRQIDAQN